MTPEEFKAWADRVTDAGTPAPIAGGFLIVSAAGGWTWWCIAPLVAQVLITLAVYARVDLDFS